MLNSITPSFKASTSTPARDRQRRVDTTDNSRYTAPPVTPPNGPVPNWQDLFNPKNWNTIPNLPSLPPFPSPNAKTPPLTPPPKQPPLPTPPKDNKPSNPLDDLLGPDKKPDNKPPENQPKPDESDKPKPAEEAINPTLFNEGKKLADGFFKDPSKLQDQFKGFQKRLDEMKTPEEKGILIKGFMTALEASLKDNKPA